jgi:hypothetical protein
MAASGGGGAQSQKEAEEAAEQDHNVVAAKPAALDSDSHDDKPICPPKQLTTPQVVKQICTEGTMLKWDSDAGCYVVLDGDGFKRRFDELRLRSKQKGGEGAPAPPRTFSTMCKHYTILPGPEGPPSYAKTGCKFRPIANEKDVDDGAPCAYACGFSERRAARASACVIGSR